MAKKVEIVATVFTEGGHFEGKSFKTMPEAKAYKAAVEKYTSYTVAIFELVDDDSLPRGYGFDEIIKEAQK